MADYLIISNLNLGGNELKNFRVEKVSSLLEATAAQAGRIVFLTTDNKLYLCNGTAWVVLREYTAGEGLTLTDGQFTVKNPLSDAEKKWIADQLFAKLFTGSISAAPSSHIFAGAAKDVVFTLSTKYDGKAVDCDSVPSGWTRTGVGTYTKTVQITSSTGSSVTSGGVTCVYQGNSKSVSAAYCTNTKYSFYIESTKEALAADDLNAIVDATAAKISTSNSITGDKKYTMKSAAYLYFVVSNTSSLSDVQAMNVSILQSKTPVSLVRTDYGTYKVYRSGAKLGAMEQSFTIK